MFWKRAALPLAAGVLLILGQWQELWPRHDDADWRAAARYVNELTLDPGTPVICPSPFIEGKSPAWKPDYALPGFLYAHLSVYPISGKPYLFPIEISKKAEQYATNLSMKTLSLSERFLIYGKTPKVQFWRAWFSRRPELAQWRHRNLGQFGSIEVVVFENGLNIGLPPTR